MPYWLDRWVIVLGLATFAAAGAAIAWPTQHVLQHLAGGLAFATAGHAFYKSRGG
jgi:hypothetical protein